MPENTFTPEAAGLEDKNVVYEYHWHFPKSIIYPPVLVHMTRIMVLLLQHILTGILMKPAQNYQ